jgi:integrase
MKEVETIRDPKDIAKLYNKLIKIDRVVAVIFRIGINTGLRAGDILNMRVWQYKDGKIYVVEEKTGKKRIAKLPTKAKAELDRHIRFFKLSGNDYVFPSPMDVNNHIAHVTVWRKLKQASKGLKINVGTHTMRKTFGYQLYKKTKDLRLVMEALNHSDMGITLRYIGVTQDQIDDITKIIDF